MVHLESRWFCRCFTVHNDKMVNTLATTHREHIWDVDGNNWTTHPVLKLVNQQQRGTSRNSNRLDLFCWMVPTQSPQRELEDRWPSVTTLISWIQPGHPKRTPIQVRSNRAIQLSSRRGPRWWRSYLTSATQFLVPLEVSPDHSRLHIKDGIWKSCDRDLVGKWWIIHVCLTTE